MPRIKKSWKHEMITIFGWLHITFWSHFPPPSSLARQTFLVFVLLVFFLDCVWFCFCFGFGFVSLFLTGSLHETHIYQNSQQPFMRFTVVEFNRKMNGMRKGGTFNTGRNLRHVFVVVWLWNFDQKKNPGSYWRAHGAHKTNIINYMLNTNEGKPLQLSN